MPENSDRRHCSCQALSLCKKARRKLMHLSLRLAFARTSCTPMTHCVPMGRNSSVSRHFGTPDTIRTCDLQSRSFQASTDKMLYFQGLAGFHRGYCKLPNFRTSLENTGQTGFFGFMRDSSQTVVKYQHPIFCTLRITADSHKKI